MRLKINSKNHQKNVNIIKKRDFETGSVFLPDIDLS